MSEGAPVLASELVVRLYSVARGLEDEGQNNIAKLFRAAALGEIYRASQNRPRWGAGLEDELEDVVAELVGQESTTESLAAGLFRGLEAIQNGEWPLLAEIPQTYVCRFCGAVMVGTLPDRCSHCSARPLTFQESVPVFYLEPLTLDAVRQALQTDLNEVIRQVDGVTEDEADRGVWPMRDMLSHLDGAQTVLFERAQRMLAEDEPVLGSIPPTEVRTDADPGPPSMEQMLSSFRQTRLEIIEWTDNRSAGDLLRGGYHPEWGRLTILGQLTYLVRHEQSHLAELEARRQGR